VWWWRFPQIDWMNPPEAKSIRLLVVDDHKVVRLGLHTLLNRHAGIEVVGEAGTVAAAVEETARLQPDVVLMDVRLPDGDGFEACRKRTRTSCSLLRSWSRASAGETTSCGVSGVGTYCNPLTCPLQANGVRWAIFWQRPTRVAKERARLLNEQRIAEAAKRRVEDEANRARYLDQIGRRQPEI